jgi:hypothetical protein
MDDVTKMVDEAVLLEDLAREDRTEYDRRRSKAAETLGIRVSTLDREVDALRKKRAKEKKLPETDAALDIASAGDLPKEADILARFGKEIERAGLVGETANAKILYLALTSRLFERPVSIAVKGVSAGGKSFMVESVLKFFPASAYFARTGFSEKALYFSDEDFRHRIIVIFEAIGMESDYLSYVIRTLLSENRLSYELPVKTEDGMKPQVLEKEGPTGLITTTTAAKLHPENETRLLSLGVTDTKQQTKAVMHRLAGAAVSCDHTPWQVFQEWLATGSQQVVVPYASMLADRIPPVAVRLRRDFGMLLSLIRAHALLHRETRDKDDQGRVVASFADYTAVYHLVEGLFAEGIEATVPTTVRETVEAVREYLAAGGSAQTAEGAPTVSLTALAKEMKLDKNSVHHRVRKAISAGYLANQETRRGKPAQIVLADPLPEESEVLPPPGVLECWSYYGGDVSGEAYPPGGGNGGLVIDQGVSEEGSEAVCPPDVHPPENASNTPTVPVNGNGGNGAGRDDGIPWNLLVENRKQPFDLDRACPLGPGGAGDSLDDLK